MSKADARVSTQYYPISDDKPNLKHEASDTSVVDEVAVPSEEASSRRGYTLLARLEDWWVWELLGLVISGGALIAIVVILNHFDNAQQPDWKHVSLNTVVSWLSTLAKAMVLVPITRGLGQLKWIWFEKKARTMADLQVFDSASRGTVGSLELLIMQSGRHFAGIAAVGMILALGFDPFVQNLIHYVPHEQPDLGRQAYVTNTSIYGTNGPPLSIAEQGPSSSYYLDPVMKSNLYNALMNTNDEQPWSIPQFQCATGNCTFDPVATLAVRPLCSSFDSVLHKSCTKPFPSSDEGSCNLTTSENGLYLLWSEFPGEEDVAMTLGTAISKRLPEDKYQTRNALIYHNQTLPVMQMMMAKGSDSNLTAMAQSDAITNKSTIYATECALEICVESIQAKVSNGVYLERTIDRWCESSIQSGTLAEVQGRASGDMSAFVSGAWLYLQLQPPWGRERGMEPGQKFGLHASTFASMQAFLEGAFSGNVTMDSPSLVVLPGFYSTYATFDILQSLFYGNISRCVDSQDHLVCAANNMASAMTKTFRDSALVANKLKDGNVRTGQTLILLTYVNVEWVWIALPLLVWCLAVITWIGTAWKAHQAKLHHWRENTLPLLFLYREAVNEKSQPTTIEAIARLAADIKVRLYLSGENARLA